MIWGSSPLLCQSTWDIKCQNLLVAGWWWEIRVTAWLLGIGVNRPSNAYDNCCFVVVATTTFAAEFWPEFSDKDKAVWKDFFDTRFFNLNTIDTTNLSSSYWPSASVQGYIHFLKRSRKQRLSFCLSCFLASCFYWSLELKPTGLSSGTLTRCLGQIT